MNRGLILRIAAAVAILVSGIVHLDLYFNQDYRFASSDVNFGRSILLNAISSGIIAVALVARREWFVKAAGIALPLSTIILFAYTHAEHSFLGFAHGGPVFEPSPQAQIALIAEIAAIVLLAVSLVPGIESADASPLPLPAVGIALAVAAVALIVPTVRWQPDSDAESAPPASTATTETTSAGDTTTPTSASAGSAVAIAGFKFNAADLTVSSGTTVTWTNQDSTEHSVAADDDSFASDDLAKGATFQHTFGTPGVFSYECGIHNRMKGTITVTG